MWRMEESSQNSLQGPDLASLGGNRSSWTERVSRRWDRILTPLDTDPSRFPDIDVESVSTSNQWSEVIAFRAARYHISESEALDEDDRHPSVNVLIARLKSNGEILGTCRVLIGSQVSVGKYVELPKRWITEDDGSPAILAEVRRVAIYGGSRQIQTATKLTLWSCQLDIAEQAKARWILVSARASLVADFRLLMCEQAVPPVLFIPPGVHNVHEVLALNVPETRARLLAHESPALRFIALGNQGRWIDANFAPVPEEFSGI
jgi:hypothetical protein